MFQSIATALSGAFTAFFGFKAYIILPVFMLVLALVARMRIKDALLATVKIGAGFAGVFVVFSFFVTQISPAIQAIIALRGLNYPVVDIGWPPLAAITWSSALTPMIIPLIMAANLVMLLTRMTKTLYIDLWNYWHFALIGVLLQNVTSNAFLAIAASLLIAIYTIKTTEWSAPYVKREMNLDGIAISPISVSGFLPYAVVLDGFFDAIPGLRKLNWNPSQKKDDDGGTKLLREPMVIGILVGVFLSLLAGYNMRMTLETAVNIAAVMFMLPRCGGLIGEGNGSGFPCVQESRRAQIQLYEGSFDRDGYGHPDDKSVRYRDRPHPHSRVARHRVHPPGKPRDSPRRFAQSYFGHGGDRSGHEGERDPFRHRGYSDRRDLSSGFVEDGPSFYPTGNRRRDGHRRGNPGNNGFYRRRKSASLLVFLSLSGKPDRDRDNSRRARDAFFCVEKTPQDG